MTVKNELLWRAFTQYPYFHRGLEIECGNADRIRVGRRRGLSLYGISSHNLIGAWKMQGLDPYIKIGSVLDLPYPDESFDFVTHPSTMQVDDYATAIKEIYRVGSRSFYMNLFIDEFQTKEMSIKLIVDAGFRIEAAQESMFGNLIIEARKG